MKIKKIIAGVAAAVMACTTMAAMSVSAINAGGTSIDFEDGDFSFVYMNVDSGADNSVLSVEDYNGSKRLKVDVQDKKNSPKVWFDLDKITDRSNTVQIRKITFDLTIVPKSAEGIVGWAGGAVGAAGGFDPNAKGSGQVNPNWSQKEWNGEAYDPGAVAEIKIERKFMMRNEFYTEDGINPFFGLMRWPVTDDTLDNYVMYIDNVQLLDEKGNALPIGVTPAAEETTAAPEETTAAPAETEAAPVEADDDEVVVDDADDEVAAPAETEAPVAEPAPVETAPVADTTTTPAATGNVAVASIAAVMAVAGAAAIVAKKRK